MIKSFLKEIIIILLLLLIIILLSCILFYDYIPSSKTVPSKVEEYALDEIVQEELNKELNNLNSEEIVKTYKIDSKDIANYERTNEYDKGKVNPFEPYSVDVEETNNNITNSNTHNNNTNNSSNNNINSSKDNFLNTTGK